MQFLVDIYFSERDKHDFLNFVKINKCTPKGFNNSFNENKNDIDQ